MIPDATTCFDCRYCTKEFRSVEEKTKSLDSKIKTLMLGEMDWFNRVSVDWFMGF